MAKVPNGVETLPKTSNGRQTDKQTDDRNMDGRQHIANSSRSLNGY